MSMEFTYQIVEMEQGLDFDGLESDGLKNDRIQKSIFKRQ